MLFLAKGWSFFIIFWSNGLNSDLEADLQSSKFSIFLAFLSSGTTKVTILSAFFSFSGQAKFVFLKEVRHVLCENCSDPNLFTTPHCFLGPFNTVMACMIRTVYPLLEINWSNCCIYNTSGDLRSTDAGIESLAKQIVAWLKHGILPFDTSRLSNSHIVGDDGDSYLNFQNVMKANITKLILPP